ncbi:MAG: type II toxin-antitoxin system VapC family toxin [Isosphaeraceae bacterium]
MRRVFADSVYWIALANPQDQWHPLAVQAGRTLIGTSLVTTQEVLTEFLAHFSGQGRLLREAAVRYAERLLRNPDIVVRQQSHQTFFDGFALYKARPDKHYSLTDCISMEAMRQLGIYEVLTHDSHFAQEGFTTLM